MVYSGVENFTCASILQEISCKNETEIEAFIISIVDFWYSSDKVHVSTHSMFRNAVELLVFLYWTISEMKIILLNS